RHGGRADPVRGHRGGAARAPRPPALGLSAARRPHGGRAAGGAAAGAGAVSVSGLQHVLVLSDDLEATREFYSAALGLTVGERPPLPFPGYWLYAEGEPCLHIGERGPYLAHARTLGL